MSNIRKFSGITADSRLVRKGFVFVAIKGLTSDGHDYIPEAIKNGAKLIVGEQDLTLKGVDYLKVDDSREYLGELASEFYGNPSEKLKVIGVTGTKGKTTTCHLIHHILTANGKKAGLISSIIAKIGDREVDTGFHVTNPDTVSLQKFLSDMVEAGAEYAVVEVSSHGIDQKRIAGTKFDFGVLTNIAPEHLDYHKTFSEYKKVKMSFIKSCKYKVIAPKETDLDILPGKFNNLDAEAALMAVEKLGISREAGIKALKSFKLPEGRLEEVKNDLGIRIIIDFAHTPGSLEAVLTHLKAQTKGRLIAVFGCAGERDTRKRFQMGKISVKLADLSVFTAEDPRTESLFGILNKMLEGAKNAGGIEDKDFVKIPERGEAIAFALSLAKKGDIVAFLGKGHEKSISFEGFEHPWSDRKAIETYLQKDKEISAIVLAAGKGTRMRSNYPKVLQKICGRPMIAYSLENLRAAKVGDITAVISFKRNIVKKYIQGAVKTAIQKNPKGGTGDAVRTGLPNISKEAKSVMVLYGDDTAFYTPQTISKILELHEKNNNTLTFITLIMDNPLGLGRIVRDGKGKVVEIVEEKNATTEQRQIKEVNDGLYIFNRDWLEKNIDKLVKNSLTGEYYINELIREAILNEKVMTYTLPDDNEWQGINTPEELAKAKAKMEERLKSFNE
jgi:UDP-N-acetylmuramoyl-L-alanyl-D-glutamate--2,6-diaminopimelate ligase